MYSHKGILQVTRLGDGGFSNDLGAAIDVDSRASAARARYDIQHWFGKGGNASAFKGLLWGLDTFYCRVKLRVYIRAGRGRSLAPPAGAHRYALSGS